MDINCGDIFTKMCKHASKWREIGAALDFSQGEMDNIQTKPLLLQSAPESWLRELLTQWLQRAPGSKHCSTEFPTRKALRMALLKVNLGQLAEEL